MDNDFIPNFKPLEMHLGRNAYAMGDWMWMYRANGLEFFKHCETRHYLVLDVEGNAYEALHPGSWTPVAFETAYARATRRTAQ